MLQEVLALCPEALTRCPPALAGALALVGVGFWFVGGRFSRAILTLIAVAVGAYVGVRLPRWFGWSIDGMGLAVSAAMLLGLSAYLIHRTFVGAALGAVLALWAAVGVWVMMDGPVLSLSKGGTGWTPPQVAWAEWHGSLSVYLKRLWDSWPPEIGRVMPYACGTGMASGILLGLTWPKLSRALLFSLLGVSLVTLLGIPLIATRQPQWLVWMPAKDSAQASFLGGFALLGVLIQWRLMSAGESADPSYTDSSAQAPRSSEREPAGTYG